MTQEFNRIASKHLLFSERLKDAERDLSAFNYRDQLINNGVESADLQLSRLEGAVSEAQADLAVFYDETGTSAQDFE